MSRKITGLAVGLAVALIAFDVALIYMAPVERETPAEGSHAATLAARAAVGAAKAAVGPTVPSGVILFWPDTSASIPAGWSRQTSLDTLYVKGAAHGAEPNVTGGSASHTHSSPSHSHSINAHTHSLWVGGASDYSAHTKPGSDAANRGHTHSVGASGGVTSASVAGVAVTYNAMSNEVPNRRVIFIQSNGTSQIPPSAMGGFAMGTLPAGWEYCDGADGTLDYRNRFIKGADAGGNGGGASDPATHAHTINHGHSVSHAHGAVGTGGPSEVSCGRSSTNGLWMAGAGHGHTVSVSTHSTTISDSPVLTFDNVEPAYRKVAAIQNFSGGGDTPRGIIALWLGNLADIPAGWVLCNGTNGTPDMRDRFLKVASNTGEIGDSGGSASHLHGASSHSHSSASHSHTCTIDGHVGAVHHESDGASGYSRYGVMPGSVHTAGSNAATLSLTSGSTSAYSSNHEPPYRTVVFIQYVNTPPGTPSNPTPTDGETIGNDTPQLSWTLDDDVDGDAVTCYVTMSRNADMSSPIVNNYNNGSANTYQSPILANGTYYWQVRVYDGRDNTYSAIWSFTVDTPLPTCNIDRASGYSSPTNSQVVQFQVTFSEPVTSFGMSDVVLNLEPDKFTGGEIVGLSGSGTDYRVSVGSITGTGWLSISVVDSAAIDAAGNPTVANISTPTSCSAENVGNCNFLIDQGEFTCAITRTSSNPSNGTSVGFQFKFNKTTTSFDINDVTMLKSAGITTAIKSDFAGSGDTYTMNISSIEGTGTVGVNLAGGVVQDEAGNGNFATSTINYSIDQGRPTCSITRNPAGAAATTADSTVGYTITFSEPVTGFTVNDVVLTGTAPGKTLSNFADSGDHMVYTVNATNISGSGTVSIVVGASVALDSTGNGNIGASGPTYTIDKAAPMVASINRYSPSAQVTNEAEVVYAVTFNESVSGVELADFELVDVDGNMVDEELVSLSVVSDSQYLVTVGTGTDGTGNLRLDLVASGAGIIDQVGNALVEDFSSGQVYTIDRQNPSVTAINRETPLDQNCNTSSVVFQVTFGKDVVGVDVDDFVVVPVSGSISDYWVESVSAISDSVYDVTVNTGTGNGVLRLDVPVPGATIEDTTGNPLVTGFLSGQTYNIDRNLLTCTISRTQPNPNNAAVVGYAFHFSRAVSDFTADDLELDSTIPGVMLGALTGSLQDYNINVLGLSGSGTVSIALPAGVVHDEFSNPNQAAEAVSYTIDQEALFCTINKLSLDPTNAHSVRYSINFSKPVDDFDVNDIVLSGTVSGMQLANFADSGNHQLYEVQVVDIDSSGVVRLSVNAGVAHDSANNPNYGYGPEQYTIDQDGPTCTVSHEAGYSSPSSQTSVRWRIVLNESVSNFALPDIIFSVSSGFSDPQPELSLSGSGKTYSAVANGLHGNGTVSIQVPAAVASDALNNPNTESAEISFHILQDDLTVTVEQEAGQPDSTSLLPVVFRVEFSDPVSDFDISDVNFTGSATVSSYAISGSGSSYRLVVDQATSGAIVPNITAGGASNSLGYPNQASTSVDNSVSYNPGPAVQPSMWYSTRDHGATGIVKLPMLPDYTGSTRCESRQGGITQMDVFFTEAVTLAGGTKGPVPTSVVEVFDSAMIPHPPTSASLSAEGRQLSLVYDPPLTDAERYTFKVVAGVFEAVGTGAPVPESAPCTVVVLHGDANQSSSTSLLDVAAIRMANRQPVTAGNACCDLNCDGQINLIDMALARNRTGQSVP